jgi:chaperonin GroES
VWSCAGSRKIRRPKAASSFQTPLSPIDLKAGDFVLFGKWSGTEVKIEGEELLIMKESDVMGVIEGRPARKAAA